MTMAEHADDINEEEEEEDAASENEEGMYTIKHSYNSSDCTTRIV